MATSEFPLSLGARPLAFSWVLAVISYHALSLRLSIHKGDPLNGRVR